MIKWSSKPHYSFMMLRKLSLSAFHKLLIHFFIIEEVFMNTAKTNFDIQLKSQRSEIIFGFPS